MIKVGVHVSIAGSLDLAVDRAKTAGCDVFQMFSRNPRGWSVLPLLEGSCETFKSKIRSSNLIPVDHMPYLPNLASPKSDIYDKSIETLIIELDRCERLGIPYLVTHLGHHLGDGIAGGRARVIKGINRALNEADNSVMLVLENTAGEKNSVGSSFEHIRAIMDGIENQKRIGVCFDTCHAFAAGYDIRTEAGISETLRQFDDQIGIKNLQIEETERLILGLRQELTSLIRELRPVALGGEGLVTALKQYAEDWSRQNLTELDIHVQGAQALPLNIEQTVFRIVQEALSNIARHSKAGYVDIQLVYDRQNIASTITDNGIGFDQNPKQTGFGLRSIKERTLSMGGKLTIKSAPGEGTIINFVIPINRSSDGEEHKFDE